MAEGVEDGDSGEVMLGTPVPPAAATPLIRELDCAPTQQHPINLKSEDSDRDSDTGSPEPANTMGAGGTANLFGPQLLPGDSAPQSEASKAAAAAAAHLNGAMAGMLNLQNLQSLASMQALPQVPPQLAAGLQGLSSNMSSCGLNNNNSINSPLNLSVGAQVSSSASSAASQGLLQTSTAPAMPTAMPQLILASGQLVQGIQGAQLLIPTSQGIATQTILTIPVNHVNSSDQMVNLALSNGQVVTTSLANLQAMAQPHQLLNTPNPLSTPPIGSNLLNSANLQHLLPNGAQQLLSAMQPSLSQSLLTPASPILSQNNNIKRESRTVSPTLSRSSTSMSSHRYNDKQRMDSSSLMPGSTNGHSGSNSAAAALNSINRLAATNGEITITTTHLPPTSSSHQMKASPASLHLSPTGTDNSNDLLADSPNQPTINQTSCNVVDGINLDEIKEFAKAFKLRRLSLGLTQTQVGQALSVTEGPAYSQSAICSALAAQMYCAAQLSTQQQNMFEKLDITPKSAQKIKPVLERWMKEAEERYKSGQNHLTDFIGVEPSKKRKRRTSFTPQALELLNAHFERNTHPSGTEITGLAHQLGYEREVIRIWFCNKRQALKNTVRMMSKGMV